MADANWQKVREVFDAALQQQPDERQSYLKEVCGDDEGLRAEIESLFTSLEQSESFLETPAVAHVAALIVSPAKSLTPGTQFGHYSIIRLIGIGGMGEVYLARDQRLDRDVAIKILNEKCSQDEANLRRFVGEAKAASALNHPNILVIHEIGESEDAHFIISEFIEGRTLREVLSESQMSLREILDIATQIAGALSAAHEEHLVHRDIKPENVMVRPDGYVKVLDFGIAKLVLQEDKALIGLGAATGNQTAKGVILGTVNYMSPEQAKGDPVDERTDIFSFGVVIYEMLAGRVPFRGDSLSETFANLINAEPQPLSGSVSNVPDKLSRIVAKALRKNKDVRYQSMKDVLTELEDLKVSHTLENRLERSLESAPLKATASLLTTMEHAAEQRAKTKRGLSLTVGRHRRVSAFIVAAVLVGVVALGYYFFYSTKKGASVIAEHGTENEDAYRLYLQGISLYDKRTLAETQKAVGILEQAIQLDPNYARAWALKAHVHRALGNFGGDPRVEYEKSMEAINHALALNQNLADAYSALCENKLFYEWDFDGAERECKRAIELDVNSARAHDMYSRYLYSRGRFDEAIAEIKTAIDLAPTQLFIQRNYGVSLFYARRYTEAVAQFKRVAEVEPNFVATYAWFVPALNVQGNTAEAFEWFIKWQAVLKTDEETVQGYKNAYQTSGWQGIGRERVKRFDERKIRSYFLEACLTVHTRDKDKAFEYLEKSYQRHEWGMSYLQVDPSLDALRADPRFRELVRRVALNRLEQSGLLQSSEEVIRD